MLVFLGVLIVIHVIFTVSTILVDDIRMSHRLVLTTFSTATVIALACYALTLVGVS